MTRNEHLLTILAEECAEIQQAVTKALRFGLYNHHPAAPPNQINELEILYEFHQLCAVMKMLRGENVLHDFDEETVRNIKAAKEDKVEKYLRVSKECGRLEE